MSTMKNRTKAHRTAQPMSERDMLGAMLAALERIEARLSSLETGLASGRGGVAFAVTPGDRPRLDPPCPDGRYSWQRPA